MSNEKTEKTRVSIMHELRRLLGDEASTISVEPHDRDADVVILGDAATRQRWIDADQLDLLRLLVRIKAPVQLGEEGEYGTLLDALCCLESDSFISACLYLDEYDMAVQPENGGIVVRVSGLDAASVEHVEIVRATSREYVAADGLRFVKLSGDCFLASPPGGTAVIYACELGRLRRHFEAAGHS
jgi:hypothetical protein